MLRTLARLDDGKIIADATIEDVIRLRDSGGGRTWTDIHAEPDKAHDLEKVLVEIFRLPTLAADNILRRSQHARIDDWGESMSITLHFPRFDAQTLDIEFEETDIVISKTALVTIHERGNAAIDHVFEQTIRNPKRLVRGVDNLLFQVIDAIMSEYMPIIDYFDEWQTRIEDEVFDKNSPETLSLIFRQKRALIALRRELSGQREVMNRLGRDDYDVIDEDDRPYFRDLYEHVVRLHEITESLRDLTVGALDTYLSVQAQRTNDVMKTLTVFTVFFMPISFITGLCGMNFFGASYAGAGELLPARAAFWITAAAIVMIPFSMYVWMRRRRWL